MPNYVTNKLIIYCPETETMEKIKKLLFAFNIENTQIYSMEVFMSKSRSFSYSENLLIWNWNRRGAKCDAIDSDIYENDDTITIIYKIAFSPNSTGVELFCSYIDSQLSHFSQEEKQESIKMQLWYWELGLDFGRITKWSPETEFENKHYYNSSLGFAIEHDDKLYESILRLKLKD